jgi:hypothetical protein
MTAGPPTLAPPTLHFVALTVTDLDTSVEWYGRLFGLQLGIVSVRASCIAAGHSGSPEIANMR